MAFTTNLSGTAQVDDSLVLAFDQQFIIAAAEMGVLDQFVQYKKDIGAKSIQLTKYNQLALATTPLTETDDVVSEAMSDSQILITPQEYGMAVTKTALASLQSGGKIDLAAAKLVGMNMGRSQDALAAAALDASGNVLTANAGAENTLAATDVATVAFLNKLYNKLARANIMPLADGFFVLVCHDDVIYDIRNATGAGSWMDINKYRDSTPILKNEVGNLAGFRIVRDNLATLTVNGGAAPGVDVYNMYAMGFNGLGKGEIQEPGGVLSGPFDKLGRFVNVGWKGCFNYKIVDQDAVWLGQVASSIGANAS